MSDLPDTALADLPDTDLAQTQGVDLWFSRHVSLTIDGRWMRVAEAHPSVSLIAVTNPDQVISPMTTTDIEPLYTFESVAVRVNRFRVLVGLKVVL